MINIHFPIDFNHLEIAKKKIIFEEFFFNQLRFNLVKINRKRINPKHYLVEELLQMHIKQAVIDNPPWVVYFNLLVSILGILIFSS